MTLAVYKVELATVIGANPGTWTDISSYVKHFDYQRGRDDWLNTVSPGTARLVCNNQDGRFSPDLASSPLYPNVEAMRAVRITCTFLAVSYALFFGYIQSVIPLPKRSQRECEIQLMDGSCWLQLAKTTPAYTNNLAGTEMGIALDAANWPTALDSLDNGISTFQPAYTNQDSLTQCNQIAVDNEGGLFYFEGHGWARFEDRHYRLTNAGSVTSQATFASTMVDLRPERPARDIANAVTVTYLAGGTTTATDTTSQTNYGPRALAITASFLAAGAAADRANWTLSQRKNPHARPIMSLRNGTDALYTQMLARLISDRITVQETVNTGVNGDFFIESIRFSVEMSAHVASCDWQLTPVDKDTYWSLGVSGYSEVGVTTRIGY